MDDIIRVYGLYTIFVFLPLVQQFIYGLYKQFGTGSYPSRDRKKCLEVSTLTLGVDELGR